MNVVFNSITQPDKIGYRFDSEGYEAWPKIAAEFLFQDKSSINKFWAPVTFDMIADYWASLATILLENEELCRIASWRFRINEVFSREQLDFARSCVWTEKDASRPRYYSLQERRTSAVRSKQHDKRYFEMEHWMDGSPASMFRLLCGEQNLALKCYYSANAIREYLHDNNTHVYMEPPAEFLKWSSDYTMINSITQAWSAVECAIKIHLLKKQVNACIENYVHYNMVHKLES